MRTSAATIGHLLISFRHRHYTPRSTGSVQRWTRHRERLARARRRPLEAGRLLLRRLPPTGRTSTTITRCRRSSGATSCAVTWRPIWILWGSWDPSRPPPWTALTGKLPGRCCGSTTPTSSVSSWSPVVTPSCDPFLSLQAIQRTCCSSYPRRR